MLAVKAPRTFNYQRPFIYPKQLEAIFEPLDTAGELARYGLIEASTKTGKTLGCIIWLFEQAYCYGAANRNYWWIAPSFSQAEIAFRRMKFGLPRHLYTSNEGKLTITLPNGAVIWFKSGEKPDGLYGEDVFAAVIDEASRMREEAWHAIRSTLTATRGPIRIIGNVKGRKNWFYAMARKAEAGAPNMCYKKLTAYDAVHAGILAGEEVEDAKRQLPDHVFRELYLAESSADGGNPFGGDDVISRCVAPLSGKKPAWWGWDLAKSVDYTVGIALDIEGKCCEFHRFQKPWRETIKFIKDVTKHVPAMVDSTGVGDPVLEELQADGHSNFEGYKFNPSSKQRLMEGLAVAINSQEITYPAGTVEKELQIFEYVYTRSGVQYSAPDGFHDDCVCSLALVNSIRKSNKTASTWRKLAAQMQ